MVTSSHATEDSHEPESSKWSWRSLNDKTRCLVTNITIEPVFTVYLISSVMANLATQNLSLEKACRVNLALAPEVCDALSRRDTANFTMEEEQVQQLVANMTIWRTIVQSALPCILILFIGSWSDRHARRRPCLVAPVCGELLASLSLIACTYWYYELPMEAVGAAETVFPSLFGGWFTMFMAAFSYVSDITTHEARTRRLGAVNICVSIGYPLGMGLCGLLYSQIGFYGIYSTSAVLYLLSIVYTILRIKEKGKPISEEKANQTCAFVKDFFDVRHIKKTFQVVFRDGERNRKTKIILLMIIMCIVIGPFHGESAVMYLFLRYRFNWNEVDYSMFSTYTMISSVTGTIISVWLLSHVLKFDDATIGVLSCVSKILSSFVYAFATSTWVLYMAPIVEILNGTSFIAMRSMASKMADSDELGQINSLFGICEALTPLLYGPLYSAVYAATMNTVPGAFFLLGGAMTSPAVLIFLWFYKQQIKEKATGSCFDDVIRPNIGVLQNEKNEENSKDNGIDNLAFETEIQSRL